MDIVVLGYAAATPGPGHGLGILHAAPPAEAGSAHLGPRTFCAKPTVLMHNLGRRTVEPGTAAWWPPERAGQTAWCIACGAAVRRGWGWATGGPPR